MSEITRVGVDLAKSVIQVNAVDAGGKLVTNRQLSRDKFLPWCAQLPPGCLVAMEACGGAHHWARQLIALGLNAKIIAAHLVAPYRMQGKGGKNDANCFAFVQNGQPAQARLKPFQTDLLEQVAIITDGHTPFLIVVLLVRQCRAAPDAACYLVVIGKEPGRGSGGIKHRTFSD